MLSSRTRRAASDAAVSDVLVVGSGPAGLAAAHHLASAGLTVTVLERARHIGGRMATDRRGGFRLDRAVWLPETDCRELARLPARPALRPLTGGVLLHGAEGALRLGEAATRRLPAQHPRSMLSAFDQEWLRAGLARLGELPEAELAAREELPAREALTARGIPARLADEALRPLLGALLGDPELAVSSRLSDLRLRAFARQGLSLPAGGAAAVPELLAAGLPEGAAVRTGVRVVSVAATRVRTERHGTLGCRAVVLATGAAEAARLLPGLRVPRFRAMTVLHHAAPAAPPTGTALVVDTAAGRGPLAHSLAASAVDPSRAPEGGSLVTSVVLGAAAAESAELLDKAARPQLAALHGVPAEGWELLAAYHDAQAVPVLPPPYSGPRPVRLLAGLYVCGDHRDVPGPAGDLSSGSRAAAALLADAGLRPAARPAPAATAPRG